MLPDWLSKTESYVPPHGGGTFLIKTFQTMGTVMSRLRVQKGHEKKHCLPAIVKLLLLILLIVFLSLSHSRLVLMAYSAFLLLYLCTWPARDIGSILKAGIVPAALAFLMFLPSMLMNPAGRANALAVILKVFLSVGMVSIFNHTTQWNHITAAFRKLHIPGIVVFTLDITLKYIMLLGRLIQDLLISVRLRSVGKNDKKYTSVGGVMGVTFLRGTEMNREMYEAMQCRGFTDDYKGL